MPTPALIQATRVAGIPDYMSQACGDLAALRPGKQAAYDAAVASGVRADIDATYRDLEMLDQAIYECGRARAHEGLLL